MIVNTGSIQAASAVYLGAAGVNGNVFSNSGSVISNAYDDAARDQTYNNAVFTAGSNTRITNLASGSIMAVSSEGAGVRFGFSAGGSSLTNLGQITSAQDYGVNLDFVNLTQSLIRVYNGGTISGSDGAYIGSVNADSLINRGVLIGNVVMGFGDDRLDNWASRIDGDVFLGDGNDVFDNRRGTVSGEVFGGDGNDTMRANAETVEVLHGDAGTGDILDLSFSAVGAIMSLDGTVQNGGGSVGDTYDGFEYVYGSSTGADQLRGDASINFLNGFGGNDVLDGAGGGDNLWGGTGADTHIGGDDAGIDYARYDDGNYGNLTIRLDNSAFNAGAAAVGDTYNGIEGLVGGVGNDVVIGNALANYLFGGGGADYIDGQGGNDYLNGGAAADQFRFSTALGASNIDTIADFQAGVDDILLLQSIFTAIGPTLTVDEFRVGAAVDGNDYILYNSGTGQIFYDSDGSAPGLAVVFATVTAATALTIGDFVMV